MMARPQLGVIILAAGLSRRMGEENKLVKPLAGEALICRAAAPFVNIAFAKPYIITGYQAAEIHTALAGYDVEFIHNHSYQSGMASAITTALKTLKGSITHLMIALGDMPYLTTKDITSLIETHLARPDATNAITRACFQGQAGHPVIWGSGFFDALETLTGDEGARTLMKAHNHHLHYHEMSSAACVTDYDHLGDFTTM